MKLSVHVIRSEQDVWSLLLFNNFWFHEWKVNILNFLGQDSCIMSVYLKLHRHRYVLTANEFLRCKVNSLYILQFIVSEREILLYERKIVAHIII